MTLRSAQPPAARAAFRIGRVRIPAGAALLVVGLGLQSRLDPPVQVPGVGGEDGPVDELRAPVGGLEPEIALEPEQEL